MHSAASRLGDHEPAAGSGSRTASAAPLLPRLGRGSAATGGSAASAAASTLAHAATSAAPSSAGSSAECQEDLIELELVDAVGACLERLPPQPHPLPLPQGGRAPRAWPDTEEAVPAHATPSFLAFVVGASQMGSLECGGSGGSAVCSTAASRPQSPAPGVASAAPARSAGAARPASTGTNAAQEAGLPAVGSHSSFKRVLHGQLQQLLAPQSQAAGKQLAGGRGAPAAATAADAEDVLPMCPARAAAAPIRRSIDENSPVLT